MIINACMIRAMKTPNTISFVNLYCSFVYTRVLNKIHISELSSLHRMIAKFYTTVLVISVSPWTPVHGGVLLSLYTPLVSESDVIVLEAFI